MKKFLALFMALIMTVALFVACDNTPDQPDQPDDPGIVDQNGNEDNQTDEPDLNAKGEGVMTYAEFAAAELETAVVIETYVQATQSWWNNQITAYTQDTEGGYFLYNMACSEEDAAKLVPGTKIKVTGYKSAWEGEVEIIDATFEILEGSYVAEPIDATDLLGTDELINKQNMLAIFKGMTVEAINSRNGEPGDDIYVTLSKNGQSYDFCVERYLTAPGTDVYEAFATLKVGDVVDVTGFIYWYQGVNTHITAVKAAQ